MYDGHGAHPKDSDVGELALTDERVSDGVPVHRSPVRGACSKGRIRQVDGRNENRRSCGGGEEPSSHGPPKRRAFGDQRAAET